MAGLETGVKARHEIGLRLRLFGEAGDVNIAEVENLIQVIHNCQLLFMIAEGILKRCMFLQFNQEKLGNFEAEICFNMYETGL